MAPEDAGQESGATETAGRPVLLLVAWLWVGTPFAYGLYQLVLTARKLFMS